MQDVLDSASHAAAGLVARPAAMEEMLAKGRYTVECRDADGNLKWTDGFDNLVTTVGKNDLLDRYLAGSAWTTGSVYVGLKGSGAPAAADTMSSHASWSELNVSASSGVRQAMSFAAASAGAKASSAAASFTIAAAGPTTVVGMFMVVGGTSANGNTTGVLFSVGDFSVSRSVVAGDVLNVSYSVSV